MQIIYILIFIIGFFFFIFKKRKFDFYTFAFASCGVYFFPGLFGYVNSVSPSGLTFPVAIDNRAYIIYILVILTLIMGANLYDRFNNINKRIWKIPSDQNVFKMVYMIAFLTAVIFIVIEWGELTSSGKPSFGRMHAIYQVMTGLGLAYAIGLKNKKATIGLGLLMLVDLYGGNREGLLLALLAGIVFNLGRLGKIKISKYRKIIGIGALLSIVFIGYKGVYVAIQMKNWELVKYRLTNPMYWFDSVRTMEPFTTQNVLNQTIIEGITFPFSEWIKPVFHNVIVFSSSLGATSIRFSDHFMGSLYSFLHWGMASNIWAEGYAVGGMALVLLIILLYALIIPWIYNSLLKKTEGFLRLVITFSGCYYFFFVHRTGLNYMITLQKRILFAFVFIMLMNWFIYEVAGRKSSRSNVID